MAAPRRPALINRWRARFIARVIGATLLVQTPSMALGAATVAARLGPWATPASVLGHVALSLIFVRRLVHHRDDRRAPWWLPWLIETPYTAFCTGALLAFAPSLLALAAGALVERSMMTVVLWMHLVGWALGAWGSTVGRTVPCVLRRDIPVRGLPAGLDGLVIAQLSDVHCGPYVPRWMYARWARAASSLGADVITLTGDLITSGEGYLDDVRDLAARLRSPHGVVACMGNHDYFGTESGVSQALLDAGARLLRNEAWALRRGEDTLWFAGVDDRWTRRDDLAAALRACPAGACVVLLAHDPAGFGDAVAAGVALTLSGHTHGGQIGLGPVNLARAVARHTAGLFVEGGSALYVNRGIGTTGPPVRVGMWPEIALLTLRRA